MNDGKVHWKCTHPQTLDVKMAAKPEHAAKLMLEGYVCELYTERAPDEEYETE